MKATSLDWKDSEETTISQYAVSKEGVFSLGWALEEVEARQIKYDPPLLLLKLPHKEGDKWDPDQKTGKWPRVAGKIEKITVPAGTFEAIRVEQESPDFPSGKLSRSVWWFAPRVGLIKMTYGDTVEQMKSFTLPKE